MAGPTTPLTLGGRYTVIGADGQSHSSTTPGTLGGHRRSRIYGRLDCRSAARALAAGGYVSQRVFFTDEPAAIAAGYRPCAVCLPEAYRIWKRGFKAVVGQGAHHCHRPHGPA